MGVRGVGKQWQTHASPGWSFSLLFPPSMCPQRLGWQEGASSGCKQGLVLPAWFLLPVNEFIKLSGLLSEPPLRSVCAPCGKLSMRAFLAEGPSAACLSPTDNHANCAQNGAMGVSPAQCSGLQICLAKLSVPPPCAHWPAIIQSSHLVAGCQLVFSSRRGFFLLYFRFCGDFEGGGLVGLFF